jgi:VWFA-related protein
MRKWLIPLLLWGIAVPAMAAKTLSIDQMEQFLVTLQGKPDGKVAGELDDVELTERVSLARLAHWETEFPGTHTHEELIKLADMSAFLNPPASDVVGDPRPDTKTQLQILRMAVQYVANTMPRLPDFYATRETTHFENDPLLPSLSTEGFSRVLRRTATYSKVVTYREGHEVSFEGAGKQQKELDSGLTTDGEFGPTLIEILGDALRGKVEWLRWEQGASGPIAVFSYALPQADSHFKVGVTVKGEKQEIVPAYHGKFAVDPTTGAILRLVQIADMMPQNQTMSAAIEVEYAPVTIAGRTYICPVKGVAFSETPVISATSSVTSTNIGGAPTSATGDQNSGPIHIRLNDVAFTHYHEFQSEARIVTNPSGSSDNNAAGASATPTPEISAGAAGPAPTSPVATPPNGSPEQASEQTENSPSNASSMPNTAAPAPDSAAGSSSNVPAAGTVLRAQSKLVLVDVVVTDHDKPVKGLERSRFHVFEDGHERPIASFDESQPPQNAKVAQPAELPPNTYSNTPTYPETGAVNVLLLDALNTPMGDQEQVRRQMIQFLGTIKPGTEMAVFTLSSRLRMAVGFTTDVAKLRLALNDRKSLPRSAADVGAGNGESISSTLTQMATGVGNANLLGTALVSAITDFAADMKTYETDQRVPMTLDAFGQLARYLAAVPGRKNLIWFAGSFPVGLGPDGDASIPLKNLSDYSDAVRTTTDLLSAARVSVYPVDARGVLIAPGTDATNTQSVNAQSPNDDASFGVQASMQQASLNKIAMETGGHVYSTGNDPEAAVEKITANGSYYYALSYVPQEAKTGKSEPDFHAIEVKVDGAKYQLAYRRGYYTKDTGKLAVENNGMAKPMTEAAVLGAPPSTQILFQARVLPVIAPEFKGASLDDNAAGEKASSFPEGTHRYAVDLSVQLQDLTFAEETGGARHAQLQSVLVAYDDEGQVVNSLGRALHIDLPPDQYQRLLATGGAIPVRLALDLPAPAREVLLRIVVYDPASAKTGSLEIPVQIAGKQPRSQP